MAGLTLVRLSGAQARALMSANGKGDITETLGGPTISTMRSLKRKGLVSMQEWPGNGMIGTPKNSGRGWAAVLTGRGWQQWTVRMALRDYKFKIDPNDVVIIDGRPTIDSMDPREWLEALTKD